MIKLNENEFQSGAGIIPLFVEDGAPLWKAKTLLLRDSNLGIWTPPKGLVMDGEPRISAAIREMREETGLDLLNFSCEFHSSRSLEYRLPSGSRKFTSLFPAVCSSSVVSMPVCLSNEHSAFQFCSLDDAIGTINFPESRAVFSELKEDLVSLDAKQNVLMDLRGRMLNVLSSSDALCDEAPQAKWYLGGSFAANEATIVDQRVVSDVDLLCISDEIPSQQEIVKFTSRMGELLGREISQPISVSVLFHRAGTKALREPFWTYIFRHGVPIGHDLPLALAPVEMSSEHVSSATTELFRLLWYRDWKYRLGSDEEQLIANLKGTALLPLLVAPDFNRIDFLGYSNLSKSYFNRVLNGNVSDELALSASLRALDCKLNRRQMPGVADSRKELAALASQMGATVYRDEASEVCAVRLLTWLMAPPLLVDPADAWEIFLHRSLGYSTKLRFSVVPTTVRRDLTRLALLVFRVENFYRHITSSRHKYSKYAQTLLCAIEQEMPPAGVRNFACQLAERASSIVGMGSRGQMFRAQDKVA